MLTVFCVLWGDKYSPESVYQLKRQVENNLTIEHRFVCITDQKLDGINIQVPPVAYPGWWQKIGLFSPRIAPSLSLYLDLDVIITGNLDDMVREYGWRDLAAASNWAQSGHMSVQSSVMIWRGDTRMTRRIWKEFDATWAAWPPTNEGSEQHPYWGDQEWITKLYGNPGEGAVTEIKSGEVVSYKYHCGGGLPPMAKVVVFHGDPKPEKCRHIPWIAQRLST